MHSRRLIHVKHLLFDLKPDSLRILGNGEFFQCRRNITVRTSKLVHGCTFNCRNQLRNFCSIVEPFTMKLDSTRLKEIFTPDVNQYGNMFERHGYELRIVGGAVRDVLMDNQPSDIDFATTATTDQMLDMFMEEGIRTVKKGGERYGTVTAQVNDSKFETTTLRFPMVDQYTPAEFTMDWRVDASSRDFTMNALYLGFDGVVYDYYNGRDDIDRRKVQFLTDPAVSIKRTPAVILRYFRFVGEICQEPNDHDPKVLSAISTHRALLSGVNSRKLWDMLRLILKTKFKHHLLKMILQLGLAPYLGLPSNSNIEELDALFERAGHLYLRPVTILTALLRNEAEMKTLKRFLRLSFNDEHLGYFILNNREGSLGDDPLRSNKILLENSVDKSLTRMQIKQMLSYRGEEKLLTEFKTWAEINVPLSYELSRPVTVAPISETIMSELQSRLGSDIYGLSEQQFQDKIYEIMQELKLKGQS